MKKIITLMVCSVCCNLAAAQQTYTLEQLKDSARHNNITLRNARRSVDVAVQQRKEAFTKYFPNVSGTAAWFNTNNGMAKLAMGEAAMTMMKDGVIAGVIATQPVFAGGQIVNGNRLAKVGEEAACLQVKLSENEVERQTEQYYWQLVTLQEKMNTANAVDTLLGDIYKDVDVAVRAGIAMRNDLLQVQLRRNDIESQRVKLQNGIDIVRLLLAQYCGLASDAFTVRPVNSDAAAVPSVFHATVEALPEYQLLGKQTEAAKLQKNLAVGQNLPTVAVGAGYNYHNVLDNNHNFGMVFATVSVPISDWWGGSHAIKRKKIEYQKAVDEQHDKAQLLQIRMQNAWNSVQEARQQLDIAKRSIEQSEENLRLNRDYYRAGTSKMSDLLEAQLLYQQSLDRRTDAYADLQNKLLEYRQATGQ